MLNDEPMFALVVLAESPVAPAAQLQVEHHRHSNIHQLQRPLWISTTLHLLGQDWHAMR